MNQHDVALPVAAGRSGRVLSPELRRPVRRGASVVTDHRGVVVAWCARMEQMLGYPSSEIEGAALPLSILDPLQLRRRAEAAGVPVGLGVLLLPPTAFDRRRDRQVDLGALDRRRADMVVSGPQPCDWTLRHRDGHEVVASVSVAPVVDAGSRLVGYQVQCLDVTEDRCTHSLLVEALIKEREVARRLADLDAERDLFVANASHELRTPVTSILGYAELLHDQDLQLDPRVRDFLAVIERNASRLRDLADDLLVLSRADAGHRGSPRPTDLGALVLSAQDALEALAVGRCLDVGFDAPATPVSVLGEPDRLERVLLNLMSNAIKFTPHGGRVRCSLRVVGQRVVLSVSDTGIGISREDQQHLFSRFFRAEAARSSSIQGTGLGLSIVRAIVDEHGGEVGVESEPGRGTTVTVILPLCP